LRFCFRIYLGSPSNGLPSGLTISQNILATAKSSFCLQGMRQNVFGSGLAIMSDSSMRAKPSIEEPSNPMPSSSAPSSSSTVIANDFTKPSMSVNQSLTNFTLASLAIFRTYSLSFTDLVAIFESPF